MRKKISVAVLIVLSLAMAGCGGRKREPSEKALSIGKSALVTVDAYLDRTMDYSEANGRIESFGDEMDYVSEEENREDEHHTADYLISGEISSISLYMMLDHNNDGEAYSKLLEARNSLANEIGEKER